MKTWEGEGTFAENAKREPKISAAFSTRDRLPLFIHFELVDARFKVLGLK